MFFKIRLLINNNKFFSILISICSVMIISVIIILIVFTIKQKALLLATNSARLKHESFVMEIRKENIKAFEKTLNESFDVSILTKRIQAKFTYELMINGKKIITSNNIYSKTPSITMQLFENFDKEDLEIFPKNLIEMGYMLTEDNKISVIKISSNKARVNIKYIASKTGNSITYEFTNVKNGEIITIEIEPKIAKKIGLKVNSLEILYN